MITRTYDIKHDPYNIILKTSQRIFEIKSVILKLIIQNEENNDKNAMEQKMEQRHNLYISQSLHIVLYNISTLDSHILFRASEKSKYFDIQHI